jgi:hypothetical protein
MHIGICVNCQLFLLDFNEIFSRMIFEKYTNINPMTIRPARTELFHADRQAERRTGRQRDGQAGIETDRQAESRTGWQRDGQAYIHTAY